MPDEPRPVATDRDTLTIEETADLYARAGHPRTIRTIQRYCATGHLECTKATTSLGDKYFVHPESIRRHLAQIAEFASLEHDATERDESRPVATYDSQEIAGDEPRQPEPIVVVTPPVAQEVQQTTTGDQPRPVATPEPDMSRHDATELTFVAREKERLEKENDRLRDDIDFLRNQVHTKDSQIEALLERDRETNFLVQGLQQMLSPLLGAPKTRDQSERTIDDQQ